MVCEELYQPEWICSWNQLVDSHERLVKAEKHDRKRWIFRGQRCYKDPNLSTTLERAAKTYAPPNADIREIEKNILREFKRRLHQYTQDIPEEGDDLEWLALMRHYGAPTRLLDWTRSFFVAAYFAVKSAKDGGLCEVWALDTKLFQAKTVLGEYEFRCIVERGDRQRHKDGAIVDHLMESPEPLVHPVNPLRLNERLTIQQGLFLFPGDVCKRFEENLSAKKYRPKSKCSLRRLKIVARGEQRWEILRRLYRMNMSEAVLFPGLEGFSRSLEMSLVLPNIQGEWDGVRI
jgi:hypothetical protein